MAISSPNTSSAITAVTGGIPGQQVATQQEIDDVVGGAAPEHDTLSELAALMIANKNSIGEVESSDYVTYYNSLLTFSL